MAEEWRTYIEPVRHTLAEVTEENVLDFAREHGWVVQFVEKRPPIETEPIKVMVVSGLVNGPENVEVPFWIEIRGRHPFVTSGPATHWEVES